MAQRVETNEGDGTIVGVHKHGVTIDLDNGGTVTRSEEVKKTFQQSRRGLTGNQYRLKENRMESKKYKLLENKLRKMVREELMKEESNYNASSEAKLIINAAKKYIANEISTIEFVEKIKESLNSIEYHTTTSRPPIAL